MLQGNSVASMSPGDLPYTTRNAITQPPIPIVPNTTSHNPSPPQPPPTWTHGSHIGGTATSITCSTAHHICASAKYLWADHLSITMGALLRVQHSLLCLEGKSVEGFPVRITSASVCPLNTVRPISSTPQYGNTIELPEPFKLSSGIKELCTGFPLGSHLCVCQDNIFTRISSAPQWSQSGEGRLSVLVVTQPPCVHRLTRSGDCCADFMKLEIVHFPNR